ncbi:metallophosphoesterase family protein [Peptoniphilus stercorisuis]|uniref:DNA repair exonuclease SbcCD nuclease subunit n=1 Tax=Peptoniphilus stercorisuis TaxID=1436965 RepID=A0ABS4KDZ7_9FIRM|nr:metallophosphoesterase [Peptoniphilus stercorisuis]MBP2025506.1 DNA repair exonuclease SbcCD nuclease subunit [Peptoniphilus stercorisuis]
MKLLYFTDTHIRGNNPKNRKDNFIETLKNKLNEVVDISINENVDYILHGGDLFDRPDISIAVVSEFSQILQKFEAPIYIVSGNHDIFGHNQKTINRTMLGLLSSLNLVKLVDENPIILEKDNIKVQLTANPYSFNMEDESYKDKYKVLEKNKDVNYMIHMVHGFLLDKPFIKGVPHTLISEITDTLADITLAGHYHFGFKTINIDNKYFINPGSIVRISNSLEEIKRRPKVILIDLKDEISIKEIYLKSALPGELVLDRNEMERHKFKRSKIYEFKEIIDTTSDLGSLDIFNLLVQISKNESIPEDVRDEAIKRVQDIQLREAEY